MPWRYHRNDLLGVTKSQLRSPPPVESSRSSLGEDRTAEEPHTEFLNHSKSRESSVKMIGATYAEKPSKQSNFLIFLVLLQFVLQIASFAYLYTQIGCTNEGIGSSNVDPIKKRMKRSTPDTVNDTQSNLMPGASIDDLCEMVTNQCFPALPAIPDEVTLEEKPTKSEKPTVASAPKPKAGSGSDARNWNRLKAFLLGG